MGFGMCPNVFGMCPNIFSSQKGERAHMTCRTNNTVDLRNLHGRGRFTRIIPFNSKQFELVVQVAGSKVYSSPLDISTKRLVSRGKSY